MIGYIKVYKPELKMKDYQVYNAYYCGICKSLGKRYGLIYRNLLNFDAVFLSIALDSINEFICNLEDFRCILHPVKKKIRCSDSISIDYVTDITVYMTYKKLVDDINDDNSIRAKIGAGAFKSAYKKASESLNTLGSLIEKNLMRLNKFEKANLDSIDETADCYGEIYRDIFTYNLDKDLDILPAISWMGYNLGRWIYLIDAFEDIEIDIKKDNYNPILVKYIYKKDNNIESYKKSIRDRISFVLYAALNEASKSYDLIDKNVNSGIIKNILYEGLYSVTEKVLNGDCKNGTEKSI